MRRTKNRTNSKSEGFDGATGLSSIRRIPKTIGEARQGDRECGDGGERQMKLKRL